MQRFIWGIILIILACVTFIGADTEYGDNDAILGGVMFLMVGIVLTYSGNQYRKLLKQTAEFSIQMLRDDGKIDAREIALRLSLSEVDIRLYIVEAQKKGIIPFKIDII